MTGEELRDKMDQWGVSANDVARALKVSNGAVSLQLNNKRRLRPETEDVIHRLCRERARDVAAVTAVLDLVAQAAAADPEGPHARGRRILSMFLATMTQDRGKGSGQNWGFPNS